MTVNYVTGEILARFSKQARDYCLAFFGIMEYRLEMYEYSPSSTNTIGKTFGFSIFALDNTINLLCPWQCSDHRKTIQSLEESLVNSMDHFIEDAGETRTSILMKAKLRGMIR